MYGLHATKVSRREPSLGLPSNFDNSWNSEQPRSASEHIRGLSSSDNQLDRRGLGRTRRNWRRAWGARRIALWKFFGVRRLYQEQTKRRAIERRGQSLSLFWYNCISPSSSERNYDATTLFHASVQMKKIYTIGKIILDILFDQDMKAHNSNVGGGVLNTVTGI